MYGCPFINVVMNSRTASVCNSLALSTDVLMLHKLKYNFVTRIIKFILGNELLHVFIVVKQAVFIKMLLEVRGL